MFHSRLFAADGRQNETAVTETSTKLQPCGHVQTQGPNLESFCYRPDEGGEGGGGWIGSSRVESGSCDDVADPIEDGSGATTPASRLAEPNGIRFESHCGTQLRLRGLGEGEEDEDEEEEEAEDEIDDAR